MVNPVTLAATRLIWCRRNQLRAILPALRVAEDDPEDAAVAAARLVEQHGTVQLAQFPCDEEAKTGAALAPREKGLENAVGRLGIDARPPVRDFEIGTVAGIEPAQADLEADSIAGFAVLHRVVAKVPHHLVQVARVNADLEVARFFV